MQCTSLHQLKNSFTIAAWYSAKGCGNWVICSRILQVSGAESAPGAKKVSYPFFMAFISLLNNMELIKQIYMSASKGEPERRAY